MECSIISYNIRYDNKEDAKSGYGWKLRRKIFATDLLPKTHFASIYCFQEVLYNQYKFLKKKIFSIHSYEGYHVGRNNGKTRGEGCSIFYNSKLFCCKDKGTFALHDNRKAFGIKAFDAACPRIASFVLLQPISYPNSYILVLNTHWDHVGYQARCESAKFIQQFIQNYSKTVSQPVTVILCGDFNVWNDDSAIQLLLEDHLLQECIPKTSYTFTGFDMSCEAAIDHIFVSNNSQVEYECDSLRNLYFSETKNIPLSDHRPLWCKVRFRKEILQ